MGFSGDRRCGCRCCSSLRYINERILFDFVDGHSVLNEFPFQLLDVVVLFLGVFGFLLFPVFGVSDFLPQDFDLFILLEHVVLEFFLASWVRRCLPLFLSFLVLSNELFVSTESSPLSFSR